MRNLLGCRILTTRRPSSIFHRLSRPLVTVRYFRQIPNPNSKERSAGTQNSGIKDRFLSKFYYGQSKQFDSFFDRDVRPSPLYSKVEPTLLRAIAKESYTEGAMSSGGRSGKANTVALTAIWLVFFGAMFYFVSDATKRLSKSAKESGLFGETEEEEYLVESSDKNFSDVRGMDEILDEFEQAVDLLTNGDKYAKIGAKVPRGILLNGPPGTGKTLIAKAIAGEAGVPFLYASGSQFDEMYVGVGAKRIRKLFEQARNNAPCIIFIDEIDAVGGKRKSGGQSSDYSRMTINQLLQEMDGFKGNDGVLVVAATNLKDVLDPALLRPGRFDLSVDVPTPNKKGRKEILEHYFGKVKHDSASISLERIASITSGMTGAQLENIVNQAAIRAVRQSHEIVDLSHLEYAFDKITMGPELKSMDQNKDGQRKTAIHEGGHCLLAHILFNKGEAEVKPRKATITRRGSALGHVSFQMNEDANEESESLLHLRAHLVVAMGGRAAEAVFFGEEKVCTGAISDMQQALQIARKIVCHASGSPDQIKGRLIDANGQYTSEKKKELVDELVDVEIDNAYKRAVLLLNEHSYTHKVLIDALLKFKTLDTDEIDLIMKGKGLNAIERSRKDHEEKLKDSSPVIKVPES
ncbi:unnamed protein product [Oikopleura dioica]|uniref:AAA+ ATPase domain-containing protein n=1 Tax=Oikopleura dioica TaxID=34765 RepID=E4XI81_OIKDI|nr:unnamed protein product [Oikopleura dioica]